MNIPQARVIMVRSSEQEQEQENEYEKSIYNEGLPDQSKSFSPDDNMPECEIIAEHYSDRSNATSSSCSSNIPIYQHNEASAGKSSGSNDLQSMSTELVQEVSLSRDSIVSSTIDITEVLEWFRVTLSKIGKQDRVTLKDMKLAASEYEGFAENLFTLFDIDHNGSVSMQELVGGLGRLTTSSKKSKVLEWFKQLFVEISGEDQLLQLDEFKRALQVKGFIERFYQLINSEHNGRLTLPQLLEAFRKLTCMGRDTKWLAWFEQQFSITSGDDRQKINFNEFKRALYIKQSFFAERFFQLFDTDNSGSISLKELMDGLTILTNGSEVEKLNFLFQVYDVDGNGYIDYEELQTVLKSCMDESTLQFSDDKLNELTRALFEDTDTDSSGTITFEELTAELKKHPGVIENLTISAANWLKPTQAQQQRRRAMHYVPHWMSWHYIRNNMAWVIWLTLFFVVNFVLFVEAAIRHRSGGLTWLRSTHIAFLLPLDQHMDLHKLCGWTIVIFSTIHTCAHIINFALLSLTPEGMPMWKYFFFVHTGLGWVGGSAGLTGEALLLILIIMVLCSLPCVRKKGYFEVFYWTHNLFVLWYILLILHATHFWKWFLVPGIIYILERILRSKWVKLARFGRTYIQKGLLLPSKVTHLVLTRPANFSYQPGDYIFIQIPKIAKYEWHPFTISSSPEQQGFIWLHIRSVGTWTNKLYNFFDERNQSQNRETIQVQMPKEPQLISLVEVEQQADQAWDNQSLEPTSFCDVHPMAVTEMERDRPERMSLLTHGQDFSHMYSEPTIIDVHLDDQEEKGIEVYVDGPYGTPSTHIFQAEHAVLIGAGIGVTPFASILQSVVMRYRNARQTCPRCNHGWTGDIPSSVMRLKKVDFFWINRDQMSFEWFVSLLSQLEIEQSEQCGFERFLDMHMYMTAALRKTDVKAIGLQMALDLIHKKDKRDLITGLKTRTQAGRPDWDKVFGQLKNDCKGKVTVFFCGPPAISDVLKAKCSHYGFEFRKENF